MLPYAEYDRLTYLRIGFGWLFTPSVIMFRYLRVAILGPVAGDTFNP